MRRQVVNQVRHVLPADPAYRTLQTAVGRRFFDSFGARPQPRPDEFRCLVDSACGAPGHACLGLSWGGEHKLFSEYYLDRSAASLLAVPPASVVEVGQFASFSGKGSGACLLARVLRSLTTTHDCCVLMTGTSQVRRLLSRLGIRFDEIAPARLARVRDPEVNWGTYYQHDPWVLTIDLRKGPIEIHQPEWSEPALELQR